MRASSYNISQSELFGPKGQVVNHHVSVILVLHSTESSKGSSESSGSHGVVNGGNSGKLCGPLTPDQALRLYRSQLTALEHTEIHSYPDVYFVGPNAKKRPAVAGGNNNCGYDDEQGGYIHVPHDHLAYRYEFLKVRGVIVGYHSHS